MCGIAGELRFDGGSTIKVADRMLRAIQPRGPDCCRSFFYNNLCLCHSRVAVIGLTESANQPMTDKVAGLTLVYNGTLYNHQQIRQDLQQRGHQFVSDGDTEVVLKSYAQWGQDCVEHLDGEFAFAIWSIHNKTLFLARDRIGIKPLYYSMTSQRFRFASNLQAILTGDHVDTRINNEALQQHLMLHGVVPAPHTILRGVQKIAPATTMTVSEHGEVKQRRYWCLPTRRTQQLSKEQWAERIIETLRRATLNRYENSDLPTGLMLSGGLNSTLILALLAQAGKDIHTWSFTSENGGVKNNHRYDYANRVANFYETSHKNVVVDHRTFLDALPETIAAMPEPLPAQNNIALYLLAKHISQDTRVVQCGHGADSLFGGYSCYPIMDQQSGTLLERYQKYYFDRSHTEYLSAITPPYQTSNAAAQTISQRIVDANADTCLETMWSVDINTLMVDNHVKCLDSMAMAWGVETRTPFLDIGVVEMAAQIPPELKVAHIDGKRIEKHFLKYMAKMLLPPEMINHNHAPVPQPMRNAVLPLAHEVLGSSACRKRGLFEQADIDRMLNTPESRLTPLRDDKLWHHTLLEMWLQKHVDH